MKGGRPASDAFRQPGGLAQDEALRYAQRVHQELLEDFPHLLERTLTLLVWEHVARQAELASPFFELIVDKEPTTARWRLKPDHEGPDRWRVRMACYRERPSHAQIRREDRLNQALRAITLED